MGRRLTPLFLLAALVAGSISTSASAGSSRPSWAQAEIRLVTSRGLMGGNAASFRPQDPLTRLALEKLVAGLTRKPLPTNIVDGSATVTMQQLDARLVRALGLSRAAGTFRRGAADAGLRVPSRFGNEAAARLLSLRKNHPAKQDMLELLPTDPATRAEAAYSAARILKFSGWEVANVKRAATTFSLPTLNPWQKRVLTTGFGFVGFPYVWGGTSERAQAPFGLETTGGFDCSGFIWRVYKLHAYPGGRKLAGVLRGRTTFTMSAEVPRSKRITASRLQPGDVVFFGARGPRSKPAEVDHSGIYVGNGWLVHSSSAGVALAQMSGWYKERFAWGRRPLAEAGLGG
ncbi:MAG: C40 family peptidase [Actinomycetota bacterium]|nr:C40 family peptidase [Actinomycetota bacterium]